jgi:hypothetical protein
MSSMLLCDFHIHTTWAERLNKTITGENFVAYLDELRAEAKRAQERYGMLVLPGAEITKNYLSEKESAHVLILDIREIISADLSWMETDEPGEAMA